MSRHDLFGQSSHAGGYSAGIGAGPYDDHLIEPTTDWSGSRGARPTFGRLYVHEGDRLHSSSPADPAVLLGRSGGPGHRGGRPFFGAEEDRLRFKAAGVEYDGPQIGGIVLGLAGIALLFRMASSSSR